MERVRPQRQLGSRTDKSKLNDRENHDFFQMLRFFQRANVVYSCFPWWSRRTRHYLLNILEPEILVTHDAGGQRATKDAAGVIDEEGTPLPSGGQFGECFLPRQAEQFRQRHTQSEAPVGGEVGVSDAVKVRDAGGMVTELSSPWRTFEEAIAEGCTDAGLLEAVYGTVCMLGGVVAVGEVQEGRYSCVERVDGTVVIAQADTASAPGQVIGRASSG